MSWCTASCHPSLACLLACVSVSRLSLCLAPVSVSVLSLLGVLSLDAQPLCPSRHVRVCLTVSLCPSVLCSWTLLRTEWYGLFVSSAHPGPSLPQVSGPELSGQHCSGQQRLVWPFPRACHCPGQSHLGPCRPPRPAEATELWADSGLGRAPEHRSLSSHREPSLWGRVTGRSSRPHSLTPCPSAAAVWPCSSAS